MVRDAWWCDCFFSQHVCLHWDSLNGSRHTGMYLMYLSDPLVGTGCLKEGRVSNGSPWVQGAYLSVSPCPCWLPTGSKSPDGNSRCAGAHLAECSCLHWLPTGNKPSHDGDRFMGYIWLCLPACTGYLLEASLLTVAAGTQRWIWPSFFRGQTSFQSKNSFRLPS